MDRIDRQIVHCLQHDGRASFQRLAAVVGVSEQTVARRYRSMRRNGVLRVLVLPDPRTSTNQTWFVRVLTRPDAVAAVADALARRDDVSWVSITGGGGEITCVCSVDPYATPPSMLLQDLPKTSAITAFTAATMLRMHLGGEAEWLAFGDPLTDEQLAALSRPTGRQSPSDHRPDAAAIGLDDAPLLAELALDGRAGGASLARSLGWPRSRVSGRLEALFGSGALHTELDVAPKFFDFTAQAYIWMRVAPGELEATGRTLAEHPETGFAAAVTGTSNLMAAVNCRDTGALYAYVATGIGGLPAVHSAEVVTVLQRIKQAGTRVHDGRLVVGHDG